MLAALLSPSSSTNNTSTNSRISQVLPTVKCSTCNQPVPLAELGDHKCEGPPPLPSPNPLSPLSPKGLPVPILRKPPITPEAATKLLPGRLQGRVVGFNANGGSTDTSSSSNPSSNLNSNSRLRIDVDTARPSGSSISPLQSRSSPLSRGLDSGQSLNGGRNNIANGIGQRTHQRPPLGSSVSVSSSMSSSSSSGNGSIFSGISGSSSNTSISSSSTSPLRARGPGLPSSVSPTHKTSASASMAFGSDRIRTRALSNAGSVASSNSAVSSQLSIPRYGVGSRDREVTGNERDGDYSVSRPQFVPPAERGIDTKSGGAAGMAGVGRRGFKAAVDASSTSGYEERERPMGPQPARWGLPAPPGDLTVTAASTAPSRYLDTDAMSVSTSRSTASKSNVPAPSFSGGSVSGSAYSPSKSIPIIPAPSSTSDSYNSANKDTMPPVGLPSSPRVVRGGGGGRSITQAQGAALRDRDRSLGASERNRDLEGEREWERDRERDLRDRGREREPQQRLPVSPIESESEYGGLAYADSTDYEDDEALPPPPPPKASDNVRGAVPPSSATTSVAKKAGYNAQFGSMSLRSRSNDRPGESYGGISGSVSGSALDRVSDREKERSMTKRSQSQAPGRGGQGKRGHTRDESASSAYSSDEDDGRRGGGYRYGSSAGVKDGKARDRDRGSDKDFGDERDRRGRDVGQKAIDAPAKKSSTKKPKKCLKCAKAIEDGKWVPVDSGGVLCDKCWKAMYLPKCRRCNLPIETQAVSSSDGQLKGKYHKECFNCHTCHEPFPDRSFYVFDGRPYCAYHYHEANDSLCASSRCGQPIEGPCAVSHTGDRYHPEHMTCQYVRPREMGGGRCKARLDAEYWEVEGKMLCERHAMVAYGIAGSVSSGRENGGRRGGGSDDGWKEEEERRERERERKKKEMKNMKRVTRFIDLKGGSGLR